VKKPQPPSVEREFIDYLKGELAFTRAEHAFLKGKVERLELATFKHGNEIARDYAARTPIEQTPAEQPQETKRKSWPDLKAEWEKMTDAEKEAAIAKGAVQ
jgi:hypothetical protein